VGSKVAVLKTSPESVLKDYRRVMKKAEYKKYLPSSKDVILKLNLSWSLYFPACSTEPWQLDGVLRVLKGDKYSIIAVENKTVVTDPWKGAEQNKWIDILRKNNLTFRSLTNCDWINYIPKHEMIAMYDIFPRGFKIPEIFIGRSVLHLPTMKTHGHTTMTGAMKNAFGGLLREHRHHSHKLIHEILVDLLQIQKEIHTGIFAVMDGTVAGDGAGPRTMTPKIKNYILASGDQVAIDAVAAKMMGFDPLKIPFIKIAHDRGLGMGDVDQIDIIGDDITNVNFHFHTEKSPVIYWDQMFRKGKLSFLEPIIFHTPIFKIPIFLSAFYHDFLWYPLVGKKHIKEFMKTDWGKLFKTY